jgi:hypothetical protein
MRACQSLTLGTSYMSNLKLQGNKPCKTITLRGGGFKCREHAGIGSYNHASRCFQIESSGLFLVVGGAWIWLIVWLVSAEQPSLFAWVAVAIQYQSILYAIHHDITPPSLLPHDWRRAEARKPEFCCLFFGRTTIPLGSVKKCSFLFFAS